jgi:TolB-like protein/DNA-binding winged helix-turn-helix (wHTH) protein/Flp pilus assembly protein TadD
MGSAHESVRFGVFEVDVRAGELRKRGSRVKLQEQPFQVLALLLERPGDVVTRDELQRRLWPSHTFVDFEQGLNGAIKRLRQALGDSAESPRFVETLPRHGYRLIVPVVAGETAPSARPGWRGRSARLAIPGLVVVLIAGVALGLVAPRIRARLSPPQPASIRSIAVLPLKNLSGDPAQEYFADGMTEAMITDLAGIGGLKVISRTSVMPYKDTRRTLPQIARELGVEAVVEGSILRSSDRVRVTAQLIDAKADRHIWGKSYDREIVDVLELQSELSRSIVGGISLRMTSEESGRLAASRKVDPQAYEAYLKGRHFVGLWAEPGDEPFSRGIENLHASTDRDPTFAPAWATLASAYGSWGFFAVRPPAETGPQARAAALRALELDPTLGEAHAALGLVTLWHGWDWVESERHVRRALELGPNSVPVLMQSNLVLLQLGRFDEALALNRRAIELDPLSSSTSLNLGFSLLSARRYREAIDQLERCRRLDPAAPWPWIEMAWAEMGLGRKEAGLAASGRALELLGESDDSMALGVLGWASGLAGHHDETHAFLRRLGAIRSPTWIDPYCIAYVHEGLGNRQAVFDLLDRAVREHSPSVVRLLVDPTWSATTRADPRYADLCRRVGMPEPLVREATVGALARPAPAPGSAGAGGQ